MKEANVASTFMSKLRQRIPSAVVIKHHDASMIGLPDCSVTYNDKTLWLEFKLFDWKPWMSPLSPEQLGLELLKRASDQAPVQREMMNRLGRQGYSLYVIWVKKTVVLLVDPNGTFPISCVQTTDEAVKEVLHYRL